MDTRDDRTAEDRTGAVDAWSEPGAPGDLGPLGSGAPDGPGHADPDFDDGGRVASVPGGPDRPGMPSAAEPWGSRPEEWFDTGRGRAEALYDGTSPTASVSVSGARGPAGGPEPGRRPGRPGALAAGVVTEAESDDSPADNSRSGTRDSGARRAVAPRRGAADPVKALLHRHRELCERAVDPLEIAAGLEAHGVTDRTAARFRHRDVFSLAEELYARVPRTGEQGPGSEPPPVPRLRANRILLTLLPGALGAATVAGLRLTHGHPRLLAAAVGLLAVALATRAALRRGPLAGPPGTHAWRTASGTRASTLWLLGYALLGDGLLHALVTGGPDALPTGAPDGPWPTAVGPVLALTLACAPAAWCAHLLRAGARRRLAGSRGLEDFQAAVKPLLFGTFALFLGALTALLLVCGTVLHEPVDYPQTLALGALLLLARLLSVHGHRHAPAVVLGAAAAMEAVALALPPAGRLPGCGVLTAPVRTLVDAWGEAAVPALACGTAALALLFHAGRTLTRASAHAPTGAPD
ncbi:hypothetical protein ACFYZB_15065 [Streptomyces sp. NPDC001852]|uniref:hypothetical protein n=1 Tax=Streptomyces sp. NPDC001852 TaxID=3364619 RepID=UPI0036BFA4C5